MKLIRFFVDRPISALMVYSVMALMGVIAFFQMPVDLMPGGDSGVLTIVVGVRGGLPPEDIENLITKPVEDEMANLPNLETISSVSRKERSVVILNFKVGVDSSQAALQVRERLAKIQGKLPKDIEKPIVSRYDENQSPVLILAMSSKDFTPEQIREIMDEKLKPRLKRIKGVANIEIGGGRERKILVEFDQNRLEAYALPIRQVISQIGADNLNVLMGKVEKKRDSYYLRTVGAYKTLEDLKNLPIAVTREGSRIRLGEIAQIRDFYMESQSYSRMNREPVVSAYIQKEALVNTIKTAERIKTEVEKFKKDLDPRINCSVVSDQSIAIKKALNNVRTSLLSGALLAGIILLIFLKDLLLSSYIFISIPLSIVISLAVMRLFGLTLNVMTISGLAIATGMIVDNSIVVLENILRRKKNLIHEFNKRKRMRVSRHSDLMYSEDPESRLPGYSPKSTAVHAAHEMFVALAASTLTTIVVFVPIVFLDPRVRMMYEGLSITVSAALLISFIVSITVIPALAANVSARLTKESGFFSSYFWLYVQNLWKKTRAFSGRHYAKGMHGLKKIIGRWRKKKAQTDSDLILTGQIQPKLFKKKIGFKTYRRVVVWMMRWRYAVLSLFLVILISCGFVYKVLDKEFIGSTEENEFTIFVELPSGAKLDISDKVVSSVEEILNETPEIAKSVKTSVSRVEGWSSKIYVTLLPVTERNRSAEEIIASLRPLVSQIGQEYDAFVYFSEPDSSKEFTIDIFGYEYDKLRDLAVKMAQVLGGVPGLVDVKLRYKPGRPEVQVKVDRERASLLQFTVGDIAETLHAQIRGLRATYFLTPTAQIETVARLQEQYRKRLEDVEMLSLVNPDGVLVPIRQVASFDYGLTPSEVWRKNRERVIQVSATREKVSLSKIAQRIMKVLKFLPVPSGYYYEFGGDFPKMIETERESKFAFIIMVLLVYSVLASMFESYLQPLVILVAVPFTLVGSIPILWITQTPVTLGALIGFIMLGGIAVNNSIILMDVFNHHRKRHHTFKALLMAGQVRMRPILMTTLTTVLGLFPLIFQKGESDTLWAPMAMTVTGGLCVSTFLVLFMFPGFYLIIQDIRGWIIKRSESLFERVQLFFRR